MPPAYQEKVEVLQKANAQLRELVTRQQQYDAQHTENAMVKQELDALRSDEPVFKLHGKVLVRQDPQEAKAIVGQRLKMIEGELCVLRWSVGWGAESVQTTTNRARAFALRMAARWQPSPPLRASQPPSFHPRPLPPPKPSYLSQYQAQQDHR